MDITTRQVGDVTILDLKGKVTIGEGDVQLRNAVHSALESGGKKLLLNLEQVTSIDSSGIGTLVSAYTTAGQRGGKLKLEKVPAKIRDILMITQLITVFELYDEEGEAVESFS